MFCLRYFTCLLNSQASATFWTKFLNLRCLLFLRTQNVFLVLLVFLVVLPNKHCFSLCLIVLFLCFFLLDLVFCFFSCSRFYSSDRFCFKVEIRHDKSVLSTTFFVLDKYQKFKNNFYGTIELEWKRPDWNFYWPKPTVSKSQQF